MSHNAQCSPSRKHAEACLTLSELKTVAAIHNQSGSSKKIEKVSHAPSELRKVIESHLEKGSEADRLYQNLVKKALKPPKPKEWKANPRKWLNTFDILEVMKQYEDAHPTFVFLGVFPVDFAEREVCSRTDDGMANMCHFDVQALIKEGKKSAGMVINLDRHNQSGSHWVAWYCCFDEKDPKYGQCYYDSGGRTPSPHMEAFMRSVQTQMPKHVRAQFSSDRHQRQNTECGIFSMVFIISCLELKHENYVGVRKHIGQFVDQGDHGIWKWRSRLYREE